MLQEILLFSFLAIGSMAVFYPRLRFGMKLFLQFYGAKYFLTTSLALYDKWMSIFLCIFGYMELILTYTSYHRIT